MFLKNVFPQCVTQLSHFSYSIHTTNDVNRTIDRYENLERF